eukprot:tig00021127_g18771.t1
MAVHYKFKAAKDYDTVSFEGLFISIFNLKQAIAEQKKIKLLDSDFVISNAQSGEEYLDEDFQVPKNTAVIK